MKIIRSRKWYEIPGTLKVVGSIAAALTLLAGVPAMAETTFSGQSDTIFRMGRSIDRKNLYPAYEYLRLSVVNEEKGGDSVSLHVGGWGRADLADKTARDRYTDADLQYGFISYRGAKNNFLINAGRQFITEGVATERVDGLYLRNDFAAGFSAAAFIGNQVVTEPSFKGDELVFGGRITQSNYNYYTVGVSALKSYADTARYREEEGIDLWVHPMKQVDLTGRSSYNSITNGWMEHAYTLSYIPLDNLRVSANISDINYKDYFYRMTISAFSLIPGGTMDPNEKVLAVGGSVAYTPVKNLTVAADYKNYHYDLARNNADYYGGKVTYALPESFSAGFSIHRMDGPADTVRYNEYRVFASKKISHLDLALDFIDIGYDRKINNVRNAYEIKGAASYEFSGNLKVGADIDYSQNPDFDNEVKGLVKLTYVFDLKNAAEGRAKSEK